MLDTRITALFGCTHPIVGGTMMDLSTPEFVAALCNAGTLGVLCSAMYRTRESFREALEKLGDLTNRPFAVNLNLFPMFSPVDNRVYLDEMQKQDVGIVETSGMSAPTELVPLFRQAGLRWVHKCVGVRYAKKVAELGADAVTVVGYENGGATGKLEIGTFVLVPATVEAVSIPVIGGGGVAGGRGLAAMLALGAEGAIVGTRFLLSEECPVHPALKRALCEASELDTNIIMRAVNFPHRVWMNEPAKKAFELDRPDCDLASIMPYVSGEAARRMYQSGELDAGTVSCSQGVGMMREIKPLKILVEEMVGEASRILGR
ncbi:MAG: 2-nitropropane dioxygenase [Deltaproteobacteria bacterium RIFOXYA12_FULL_61_11]|nr:MAG: 2-nitropropane dioxygenase [Deltaproteobacteria bacterium RIFOXYA12_FULL_61_11]